MVAVSGTKLGGTTRTRGWKLAGCPLNTKVYTAVQPVCSTTRAARWREEVWGGMRWTHRVNVLHRRGRAPIA
eukprot:scaffold133207_cov66-Phaeocystis_antarctica.AAC.5